MKHKLLTLAGALALLAVLVNYNAKPVLAQLRAALVKNIDEPGRTPWDTRSQFFTGGSGCYLTSDCFNYSGGSGFATFDLRPIPAGKRWVVQSAAGGLTDANGTIIEIDLRNNRGGLIFDGSKWIFAGPYFPGTPFSSATFSANLSTTFEPGETPSVSVRTTPNVAAYSVIVFHGYLIDATN